MPRHRTARPPRSRASKAETGVGAALLLIALVLVGGDYGANLAPAESLPPPPPGPETCSDNIDNDNDGQIDALDTECDPGHIDYDGVENGGP